MYMAPLIPTSLQGQDRATPNPIHELPPKLDKLLKCTNITYMGMVIKGDDLIIGKIFKGGKTGKMHDLHDDHENHSKSVFLPGLIIYSAKGLI